MTNEQRKSKKVREFFINAVWSVRAVYGGKDTVSKADRH